MLIDRLLLSDLPQKGKDALNVSVAVEISNVHQFYMDTPKDQWTFEHDFPAIVSPFPQVFFEWRQTTTMNCNGAIRMMPDVGMVYGVAISTVEVFGQEGALPGARWACHALLFCEAKGLSPRLTYEIVYQISHEGKQLFYEGECPWIVIIPPHSFPFLDALIQQGHFASKEEAAGQIVNEWMHPVFLALSFMHCKNVTIQKHEYPEKMNKARIRRGKPPFINYHVLEIEPMKKVLRTEGQSETLGLKKALHICRGHFKDFRDGKGLFGRHKAMYWWDMHVRGSEEVGVSLKDYEVKI